MGTVALCDDIMGIAAWGEGGKQLGFVRRGIGLEISFSTFLDPPSLGKAGVVGRDLIGNQRWLKFSFLLFLLFSVVWVAERCGGKGTGYFIFLTEASLCHIWRAIAFFQMASHMCVSNSGLFVQKSDLRSVQLRSS